ncbi:DEAD/DEAH box helicase family protein [Catellatospora sp. TT07R-123]|uniref:DEAD/DEAH box helicase family protein n=1 Tax=Catellatospora sp. TT07R-123 TaxID=2733863 RepID=UPI001BB3164A|nr:DEAD/DEAH box helicase family protein [Catellatospora sp. TT07R-123]
MYEIPEDDLVGEVLVPAMAASEEVRIGAGFFTSHCFAQIAPGLASFLRSSDSALHLLISPAIDAADRDAMERGLKTAEVVIQEAADKLLEDAHLSDRALVHHTLDCLAYLVASRRLRVRFALMKVGQYHKKQWLLRSGDDWAVVHGSGNATTRGLLVNGEQMTVDRAWSDGPVAKARVEKLIAGWDRDWHNRSAHLLTIELAEGLRLTAGVSGAPQMPTVDDFWRAWHADHVRGLEPPLPPGLEVAAPRLLAIPEGVEWRTGRFAHQGLAVDSFREAGSRGILAIATGGGKTQTAMITAVLEQDRHRGPMFVLIIVPGAPLMRQWAEVVSIFGVDPFLPSELASAKRQARLQEIRAGFAGDVQRTVVAVCTQKLFVGDATFREFIEQLPERVLTMLVGDEVHNLGSRGFLERQPDRFEVRLGLSATPQRQYDPTGSTTLFEFFGDQVFEFGIQDAIRAGCLTPYNYYLHEVPLAEHEMAAYVDLTRQLQRKGFLRADDGQESGVDAQVEHLLRKRRAILEHAEAKLPKLRSLLAGTGARNISRTLIYASAKPSTLGGGRQIDDVNAMLRSLSVRFHEFTSEETSQRGSQRYLEAFGNGDYQVLTAMKVLDEGIDIPQTDTAYLLASSTVRREWVQRRGRILRRAAGKDLAHLHDFFVVPPEPGTREGRSLLLGELARVREFAGTADNEYDPDGPRVLINNLERML